MYEPFLRQLPANLVRTFRTMMIRLHLPLVGLSQWLTPLPGHCRHERTVSPHRLSRYGTIPLSLDVPAKFAISHMYSRISEILGSYSRTKPVQCSSCGLVESTPVSAFSVRDSRQPPRSCSLVLDSSMSGLLANAHHLTFPLSA